MSLDMFQCLQGYSLWELEQNLYPLLCENFNIAELVHGAFQADYLLRLLCIVILLIFENLILKHQLKILICLLKMIAIYSRTIGNFVLYFQSLLGNTCFRFS